MKIDTRKQTEFIPGWDGWGDDPFNELLDLRFDEEEIIDIDQVEDLSEQLSKEENYN